ncbi:glycosyl hydrolase family 3 [Tetragenococcus halophilus]|uniref:glycoside hydrolase family 3 C-terminal domain-containing protein n=1 Tax=Tetragenococcus halophilus TaxID=51669 RepID=UPI00083D5989|nr:glycoside hydrolase family 3 C-terminal domain-containing protein [Tetragenococcus halophilus]AOF48349.1 glycosyl hydrolase family 3 [Tetragenococcus halophilus]
MNQDPEKLLEQLSLEEKASLVSGTDFWYTTAIECLDIPSLNLTDGPAGLRKQAGDSDALGLNKSVEAINFPAANLIACSFDRKALQELGERLGNAAQSEDVSILLGPGINIKRSPLAGRNFEFFSEDPYLTGELGAAYVKGVQNKGVGVSLKHFVANNRENQRFTVSSNIEERPLREIYLHAFETIVKDAHPYTIMCSYNPLNGVLNAQNRTLLTDILRNEWGFDGIVLSDWGAVADSAASVQAGMDLEMPGKGKASQQAVVEAVQNNQLAVEDLDNSVLRILKLIQQLTDNAQTDPSYDKEKQHELARVLASNSMVLLKNDEQVLPIKEDDSLLVVGELADNPRSQGGGSSHVNAYKVSSPLENIQSGHSNVHFEQGYHLDQTADKNLSSKALEAAKKADKVVLFAGFPESLESEGFDKDSLLLPENQNRLIQEISQVNDNVVVVLQNGSVVAMPWIHQVKAILETYLAGETVGEATWDVLKGTVNPSGKLAETFPQRVEDNPTALTFNASTIDENYREGLFVGYRYYDKKKLAPLFPFGHGLSYTTFAYQDLTVEEKENNFILTVTLSNTGKVAGSEVVQVYISNQTSNIEKPEKELKQFEKVYLEPNETKKVKIVLDDNAFMWYNVDKKDWQIDDGSYLVQVGSSSADIRLTQEVTIQKGTKTHPEVTSDTYIADIMKRDDLKDLIATTEFGKTLNNLIGDDSNSKMLENIPLRAAEMMGFSPAQVKAFIDKANEK